MALISPSWFLYFPDCTPDFQQFTAELGEGENFQRLGKKRGICAYF
jgi:hypothetical protein